MLRELGVADLAWRCADEWLPWQTTAEIEPATGIVGQERAVEAIAFGLGMRGVGYNVFVTGLAGTGRLTTITRFLDQLAAGKSAPDDLCFVENLRSPDEPRALLLKVGGGRRLRDALDSLIEEQPGICRPSSTTPSCGVESSGRLLTCVARNASWWRVSRSRRAATASRWSRSTAAR